MRQIKIVVRQDKKLKTAFRIPGIKGEGVPPGGTAGQVLQKHSDSDYDTEWVDNGGGSGSQYQNPQPSIVPVGGIPAGTIFDTPTSLQQLFDMMLHPYAPPVVSLSCPVSSPQERGVAVINKMFTIGTTRRSQPITSVLLRRGSMDIFMPGTILGDGGSYVYTDTDPASDTTTWQAIIGDGQQTAQASHTITFVDPLFIGVSDSLPVIDQAGLTKQLRSRSSFSHDFNQSGHIVLLVPASWGNPVSIIDQNNFNVTSGYSFVDINIIIATGMAAYRAIVKNSPAVITGTFKLTFNF